MLKADFDAVISRMKAGLIKAESVDSTYWQSTNAPAPMPEVLNFSFTLSLNELNFDDFSGLAHAIRPNLPWADLHFVTERVSGAPLNPGRTWRSWPYAKSADTHRRGSEEDPPFDHSYAERFWPKFAGKTPGGVLRGMPPMSPHRGIRFEYGDLEDLVVLFLKDPLTRQGFLPVWFPEDLAAARLGKRVPCTLGYHFILRKNEFHQVYYIRSCDFVRHFRDDVYLSIRLLMWLLSACRKSSESFKEVRLGTFTMHITSLHLFESDQALLRLGAEGK